MKKIIILYFLLLNFFIYAEADNSLYRLYFQSNKFDDHIKGINTISKNISLVKEDIEIIKLLLDETKYDGIKNTLLNASAEDYIKLRSFAIRTIGLIGNKTASSEIIKILKKDKNLNIKHACIYALGEIGDNDKYNVTKALLEYYNKLDLNSIKDKDDFCQTSIESFYKLSEEKTLEVIEYLNIITLFKLFMKKEVFSKEIYTYSKRKLLNIMIKNS